MQQDNGETDDLRRLIASSFLISGLFIAVTGCSAEDIHTRIFNISEIGDGKTQLNCSLSSLKQKISKMNSENGTSEFETMLSFGQRKDGDGFSEIMSRAELRSNFSPGKEAAIFVSKDHQKVVVAEFNRKANVNLFLKASTVCDKASGDICTPIIYYDGSQEYCLLFSIEEIIKK